MALATRRPSRPTGRGRVTTGTEHRLVRARLARAAASRATSRPRAPRCRARAGGRRRRRADPARARQPAYFTGDFDAAWDIAATAAGCCAPDDPWQFVDLIALQGLIAHQRGEWFERFRPELRRTQGNQRLATALFDAHLCVAEYLLYGPVPYHEVIGRPRCAAAAPSRRARFAGWRSRPR